MIIYNTVKRYLGQLRIIRWIDAREWIEYKLFGPFRWRHHFRKFQPPRTSDGYFLCFSPDGKLLVVCFYWNETLETTRNGKVLIFSHFSRAWWKIDTWNCLNSRSKIVQQSSWTHFKPLLCQSWILFSPENIFTSRSMWRNKNIQTFVVENCRNLNAFEIKFLKKCFRDWICHDLRNRSLLSALVLWNFLRNFSLAILLNFEYQS